VRYDDVVSVGVTVLTDVSFVLLLLLLTVTADFSGRKRLPRPFLDISHLLRRVVRMHDAQAHRFQRPFTNR
jgi:hypothetical protein